MAIYIKVLKLKMHDYTNVCTKEGEIIHSRLIERDELQKNASRQQKNVQANLFFDGCCT